MADGLLIARVGGLWTLLLQVTLAPKMRRSPLAWSALSIGAVQLAVQRRVLRAPRAPSAELNRMLGTIDATMSVALQLMLRKAAQAIPAEQRWNFRAQSHNNALWVFPYSGILSGPAVVPGALAHVPLIAACRNNHIARVHLTGVIAGAWFMIRGIRVLGLLDVETQSERAAATVDLVEAARTAAANAVMRATLSPLIEEVRALAEACDVLSDSTLQSECSRLLPVSRSTEHLSPRLINEVARTESSVRRSDSEKLRAQMQSLGKLASAASVLWVGLSAEAARQFAWVPLWKVRAVQLGVVANAVFQSAVQPEGLNGNFAASSRHLLNDALGVASSVLLTRGAPPQSIPNVDVSARDNYLIQNSAVSGSPRAITRSWVLTNALVARSELRTAAKDGLPAQIAHLAGYQLAVPLAMQRIIGGIWTAEQKSEEARTAKINAEARRGAAIGAQRAGVAAHDYCSQTLQALYREPSLERSKVRSALDDTVRQLEAAFAGEAVATDMDLMIRECVDAYGRFGIVPNAEVGSLPDLNPEQQRAVLGAINQGLANVLAHTDDTAPTVVIAHRTDPGRVEVDVVNQRRSDLVGAIEEGFGLRSLRSEAELVGGALLLNVGDSATMLRVTIPIAPGPPERS